MGKKALIFILFGVVFSCDSNQIYSEYKTVTPHWPLEDTLQFKLPPMDSLSQYNLFFYLRNTNEYSFNNLFIIAQMQFPHGKTITDTLEYQMALPDGTWLGTGNHIKENKLWYKEKIRFFEKGEYQVKLRHAMRNNGDVAGVKELKGVVDVGISVEKAIKE